MPVYEWRHKCSLIIYRGIQCVLNLHTYYPGGWFFFVTNLHNPGCWFPFPLYSSIDLSLSCFMPGLLVTAGTDDTIKFWDIQVYHNNIIYTWVCQSHTEHAIHFEEDESTSFEQLCTGLQAQLHEQLQ